MDSPRGGDAGVMSELGVEFLVEELLLEAVGGTDMSQAAAYSASLRAAVHHGERLDKHLSNR